jgi:hypothetical protein
MEARRSGEVHRFRAEFFIERILSFGGALVSDDADHPAISQVRQDRFGGFRRGHMPLGTGALPKRRLSEQLS